MAFSFNSWNPGGVSLGYRPQTVPQYDWQSQFGGNKAGKQPGMPVETVKPPFGTYSPGQETPMIGPDDDFGGGLDKLLQGLGMFASNPAGPGKGIIPERAGQLGMLAKGNAAGTGKAGKFNEQALSALLNFGLPAAKGKGRK